MWREGGLASRWAEGSVLKCSLCSCSHESGWWGLFRGTNTVADQRSFSAQTDFLMEAIRLVPLFIFSFPIVSFSAGLNMQVKVLIPWLFWYFLTSSAKASIHRRFLQRSRQSAHTLDDIAICIKYHKSRHVLFCFFKAGSFNLPSVTSEFTRPVLREQIRVYTHSMTFNNNNNRRCLDLLAAMATGIRQSQLLCWWCPQKNRGAHWQRLWDRTVPAPQRPPLQRWVS